MTKKKVDQFSYETHRDMVDLIWQHRTNFDALIEYYRKNPSGPQTEAARKVVDAFETLRKDALIQIERLAGLLESELSRTLAEAARDTVD